MSTREKGKISVVKTANFRDEQAEHNTAWIYIEFDNGGTQGFGGFNTVNKKGSEEFLNYFKELFNVKSFKEMEGKECFALRNFDRWSDPIMGLEVDGKIRTINTWRKSVGLVPTNAYKDEVARLNRDIDFNRRRIQETLETLETLKSIYKDWDK